MDKTSYVVGMNVAVSMKTDGVESLESYDDFLKGFRDVMEGNDPAVTREEAMDAMNAFMKETERRHREKTEKIAAENLEKGNAYLKENMKKEGVKTTASGLQYRVINEGLVLKWPDPHCRVKVHYEGRFTDGTVFDSSYERGEPVVFGLDQVIPGWSEGLRLMKPGSKYELTIPPVLGYGKTGYPGAIPPNSVLIFTVELIDIIDDKVIGKSSAAAGKNGGHILET